MKPKDMQHLADVVTWLKFHVEWNDEASRDMMLRAVDVLTPVAMAVAASTSETAASFDALHGTRRAPLIPGSERAICRTCGEYADECTCGDAATKVAKWEARPQRFVCPACGFGVRADEDGCCVTCGRDCAVVAVIVEPENFSLSNEELDRVTNAALTMAVETSGPYQHARPTGSPRGQVPLSVNDTTAQDLLWEHAQRQRAVDAEFSDDLETDLRSSGFDPTKPNGMKWEMAVVAADRAVQWACVLVDDIAGWSGASGNWPLQSASGMLRGVVGLFASWAKGEYSTAICFECRSTWSGSSRSPTTPPPTCSQCGKPCIGGHWVENHAP